MLVVVVLNCVILFWCTRKINPWRNIYMESLTKSKHRAPITSITVYAGHRLLFGNLSSG